MYDIRNTNTLQHYKYTTEKKCRFSAIFHPCENGRRRAEFSFSGKISAEGVGRDSGRFYAVCGDVFFAFLTMVFCKNVAVGSNIPERVGGGVVFARFFFRKRSVGIFGGCMAKLKPTVFSGRASEKNVRRQVTSAMCRFAGNGC